MTISELEQIPINPGIAFILGLIYPLYKTGQSNDMETFIKGCINYNAITEEELANHFKLVMNFLEQSNIRNIDLKANKQPDFSISKKKGFSVIIWKENKSDKICMDILTKKVLEIKKSDNIEVKKAFARGCFDGRSSFDTTMHFLALDTDRIYSRQDLIKSIFEQLKIDLNLNRREINHPKNDQLRIKPKYLSKFLNEVGLFSKQRAEKIQHFLSLGE